MRFRYAQALALAIACSSLCGAADAPIRLPVSPTPAPLPQPMPPSPNAAIAVASDQFFVIDSDVKLVIRTIPEGLVKIASDTGPQTFKGRFVDSNGVEKRTFNGKFLYQVEPIGKGQVTIVIIPADGVVKDTDVIVRTLDVDATAEAGRKPCPEPKPVPPVPVPPTPVPPSPTDPFAKSVQDAFAADNSFVDSKGVLWDKAKCVSLLASLYANAAVTTVNDPNVKTYGDLFAILRPASESLLPAAAIPGVRKVIGQHENATLGTGPTTGPKTSDLINRTAASAEFILMSNALKGVR